MSAPLVTVTIDGRTVQVPKGTNIVEAAKVAGVEIPVFCYHPKLDPAGVCRMCLVQIEKVPKPQAACVTPVDRDGMVITTNSAQVDDLRRGTLEFLLLNHPLDCPVCDKGGECDLQDMTLEYGKTTSRMEFPKIQKPKAVDLGNFIVLDNERCILCRRCVRFDNEITTEANLLIDGRAHFNKVSTVEGQRYDSYFSGNTIEICPVGALTSELYRFQARPWDLSKAESVCTGCSVGCNITEEFRFGKLLRLTARDNEGIDQGWLCDRGRFNYKYVQGDTRLTQPLVKRDGQFVPVTWAEALEYVADKFKLLKQRDGGKAFGVIGGGKLSNEESYLLQKFARLTLLSNNVDHRVSGQLVASLGAFPGKQTDVSDAGVILVVDTEPGETAPVLDLRIRRMADRKKAKLALIGSVIPKYRGRHARIQVKPGETAAVLSALAAVAAGKQQPASAADPEAVAKLVELLQSARKVAILWSGKDANLGRALGDLAGSLKKTASADNLGRSVHVLIPGAQANSRGAEAMGVLPNLLPNYAPMTDTKAKEAMTQLWGSRNLSFEPGLATGDMLKAAAEGQIKALVLAGANLLNTWPDRKLATAALENAFVVALDLFLTETAAMADVVLPVAALSEKSGSYTTLDGSVQVVKAAKKPEGTAQPDGDVLVALSAAIGVRLAESPTSVAHEISKLVTRLDAGVTLPGAPASLLPITGTTAAGAGDLLLAPVERLYAGGGTARFDAEFKFVQPKPIALVNPAEATRLGLTQGEQVELVVGDAAIRVTVAIENRVVPGTVQAISGLPEAPVNALTSEGALVAATFRKLALEVAK